ncbi:FAD:protein FMN transferase [Flavobacterium sp. Sd200]|uniref:FAD:protein FMN transferase n=1 Tax=Flavobacterium sp. Sd200 TaxID=2692211 RepID=UPI00136EE667|nr:FAD:protein FMN transferase [Flavobacterium sp. Sd200]MXN90477.1 FAD:protein FMN transferase [Flavobacterium sp. Sd200]
MPQTANNTYLSQTRKLFHCNIRIKIPADCHESILERGFALLEYIDKQYNSYTEGSIFNNINTNAGHWTDIDENTAIMLQSISKISEICNGAYDITVMPLLRLWGFYNNGSSIVPLKEQLQKAISKVDHTKIKLDGLKVMIGKDQEIITGSFIKAFAVDVLVKQLIEEGVTNGVINAGGSTIYSINKGQYVPRDINLPHPFKKDEKLGNINISNASFSLSAAISGFITIDGKKYGHIINAKTGNPSANIQVGIICKSAFLSDVLSTALFSINEENFEAVTTELKAHFDFEAYLITQQGYIKATDYAPFKALKI